MSIHDISRCFTVLRQKSPKNPLKVLSSDHIFHLAYNTSTEKEIGILRNEANSTCSVQEPCPIEEHGSIFFDAFLVVTTSAGVEI